MTFRSLVLCLFAVLALSGCTNSIDWWLTPDQQGQYFFNQGEYSKAARAFENPLWKAMSFYAAEEFAASAAILADIDTAYARFYLGNTFAHRDMLAEASAAYLQALELQPQFDEAQFNLEWVSGLLKIEQTTYDDAGGTGGKLGADGFVFDDKAENAQSTITEAEAVSQGLTDAQIEAIWMRRVQTTPDEFLANKFAYQLQMQGSDEEQ